MPPRKHPISRWFPESADALAQGFDVDGLKIKRDAALAMSLRADSAVITADNCQSGLELGDRLAAAGDFPAAARLLTNLQAAAQGAELHSKIQEEDFGD